ncbi:MAG: ABC transporter ATP-binding protein [Spirochaetaceae bacterium]|nr:ABC transporter ATP-binding protein [Spirochaetaceae bacterium]MDT8299781.1 ABC transporter ATP-binding protein [Spirochaetaceae bacterium]
MIEFISVSKSFGRTHLFTGLDLSVPSGSIICILGPSGCGKTTLLNMAAGLAEADSGRITRTGRVSYVFQEPRLLPWCSVRDNAGYALDSGIHKSERLEKIDVMLEALELTDAANALPGEISGGMARRTALARALLAPRDIVLLDEPLSSLDPDLRGRLISRLPSLLEGSAVMLVTHDYGTAASLSDRIFKFSLPPVKIDEVDKNDLERTLEQIERMEENLKTSQ